MRRCNGADAVFLLTRLIRGVTAGSSNDCAYFEFLLTRLIRGVTTAPPHPMQMYFISTHTPHTRRDGRQGARRGER